METKFANIIKEKTLNLQTKRDIDKSLMYFIKINLKEWEHKVKPLCKINNLSYYKEILKILENSGFKNINEKKIETYIRRCK